MRRLGVHTSIAGGLHKGLEKAHELGCGTLQIFSHNPRGWAVKAKDPEECRLFMELRDAYDLSPVFIHSSYLINLASSDRDLLRKSVAMVIEEMNIADAIGAGYVVLHTGSASGDDPAAARSRAIDCLRRVGESGSWKAGLLLENTAGERGDITSKIREISEILHAVSGELIAGVCLDTCHAYSAGYDLTTAAGREVLVAALEQDIGKERLKLLHLNDSKNAAGSGVDRHEHIGEGKIGAEALGQVINHPFFQDVPLILETPKKTDDDDPRNLKTVRRLLGKK
ncbi:MAG: deoxyribonuclease IV [Nitrospirae bacterium]|nr:MAG: deoxyribonuclease IV [Nitrospirota bacterium]